MIIIIINITDDIISDCTPVHVIKCDLKTAYYLSNTFILLCHFAKFVTATVIT